MPLWLSPEQIVVMNITDSQRDFAQDVVNRLQKVGLRAKADLRNEKIGFKIREHTLQKVPYLIVVGDKEVEADAVAVRTRSGEDLGTMKVSEFMERLKEEQV
jgi:threonyl-tRNA synthetase